MIIRGLGTVGAIHGGELTRLQPAQKRILAILMAAGPDGLSSDRFAEEVWSDSLPSNWEDAVRQAITRMRRKVGLDTIVNSTRHYSLAPHTNVDVWRLEAIAAGPLEQITEQDMALMLGGEPYPEIDPSPLVRSSMIHIAMMKLQLVDRLAHRADHATTPDHVSTPLLEATRKFLAHEPYREDVLVAAARLHVAAGLGAQALQLVDTGIASLEAEFGRPVGAELHELHIRLIEGADAAKPLDAVAASPARLVGNVDLSSATATAAATTSIERSALIDDAKAKLARQGVVVTGESGSGKTMLARSLAAAQLAAGAHVVWLSGQRDQSAAYGPFLATLPLLRNHLGPLLQDGGDQYARSLCWIASLEALARSFAGRPVALFVDDAQWLDSQSQLFLEFLALSQDVEELRLVVIGRSVPTHDGWSELSNSLSRAGLESVEATDFDRHELIELMSRSHPASTSKQRVDLADAMARAKATLPAVAYELLQAADPTTLISSRIAAQSTQAEIWTSPVSAATQSVGAVAAVAGITFRLEVLALLTGLGGDQVLAAVDELLSANLIVEEQRPDEFSFRHILIHTGFESLLDRRQLRDLHLMAAGTELGHDPHRRATHLLAAGPLVAVSELSDALVASARLHQHGGSFREAVHAYSRALEIDPTVATGRLLLDFANSLQFAGADDWAIREQAFKTAQAAGHHDLSVEIAIGGAMETEDIDGDERRVALLDQVTLDHVCAASLQSHHVALARELSFLGQHDRARDLSSQVVVAAKGPDDRCKGWLACWPSHLATPVSAWPPLPEDRELVQDPVLLAQILQVECVQALHLGESRAARDLLERCSTPALTQDPLRSWFVSLLQAMVAFTDGDWAVSNKLADAGLAEAQRAGIGAAFSARSAQLFTQQWVAGKHGDLLPLLEMAAPDIRGSMLAEAALAVVLSMNPGRHHEATTKIDALSQRAVDSQSPLAPSLAAVLASASPATRSRGVVEMLTALVAPFSGTALVLGTGVASLGPASRTLSMLAPSVDEQAALMAKAIEEADQWNLRLWSVRCRLDLSHLTGDQRLQHQARELATGTDLATELFA